jgi:hypothetical protein
MSFDEVRLQRNGSGVIQTMLKRLAEEEEQEGQEKRPVEDLELPLGRNTVGTVPVETATPLVKAALY